MAFLHCPKCTKEISDTSEKCPHCGFDVSSVKSFEKRFTHLSKKFYAKKAIKIFLLIPGVLLGALGLISLYFAGFGIPLLIIAFPLMWAGFKGSEEVYQNGDCPYCGTNLNVKANNKPNNYFRCPVCNNVGVQTETTLETIH